MLGLENFSFNEIWRPLLLLIYIAIAVGYFYLIGPLRSRFEGSEPVRLRERILFLSGLFLLYISLTGPLNVLSHIMFSAHMLQMAISFLFAPPLILLGLPSWFVERVFSGRRMQKMLKYMHPIFTVVFFNMVFSFYHIPLIHDAVLANYWLFRPYYILMLVAAFMMWWPIATPALSLRRLTHLQRMAYIFASGVLLTPACALIIFAKNPLYATFTDADAWMLAMALCLPLNATVDLASFGGPEFFQLLPVVDDQQLGGVIMKLSQEIVFGAILFYIFIQWYRRENPGGYDVDESDEDYDVIAERPDLTKA